MIFMETYSQMVNTLKKPSPKFFPQVVKNPKFWDPKKNNLMFEFVKTSAYPRFAREFAESAEISDGKIHFVCSMYEIYNV